MDTINGGGYSLTNLFELNIILGKNGCGISTLLRRVEEALGNEVGYRKTKYITPERGGSLVYEAGIG